MTERETVLLQEFKDKLDKLMSLYEDIKNKNRSLQEVLLEKEEQIQGLNLQNKELSKKYEHLKLARSVTGMEENSHEAKLKINRLVREIDQCISMLNR